MKASQAAHPSEPSLLAYGLGKLSDASTEVVSNHLESCADCKKRVAELSADSFLGKVRNAQGWPDSRGPNMSSTDGLSMLAAAPAGTPAPPALSSLPPGLAEHPDYAITRELGRGGMGVVYLAQNTLMGRAEVLKVVGGHLVNRQIAIDRFLAEIRHAARLHHPNIVTAYSAMRLGESLVLAMEYVEGLDLTKMVQARGPLPVAHCCNYIHQAALGLQHAHEHGMVHRDIKPSNMMLTRQSNRALVKVLDFGLAKIKSEGVVDNGLTHEGQMLGTPDYIAPEQISNARRADIRADIYSLGCTFYYLLTAGPPFRGTSLYDILQAHHSMEAMPLNLKRPEVPVELAALVAKMMAKEPERRFQEPKEVAQALAPFFKKGELAFRPGEAEVSHGVRHEVVRPESRVISPPEGQVAGNAGSHDSEQGAAQPTEAGSHWKGLIDLSDTAQSIIETPATRIKPRPAWLWPSLALGAGVLLLGIFAAWWTVVGVRTEMGVIELVGLPRDADVLVDGKEFAVTWPGGGKPAVVSVSAGKHKVSVKKDGFRVTSRELSVESAGKVEFSVHLESLEPPADVKVESGDRVARVEIQEEGHEEDMAVNAPANLGLEDILKQAPPGVAAGPPAGGPLIREDMAPIVIAPIEPGKAARFPTRLVWLDEYNNATRGLPADVNAPHEPRHGVSDGVFYVYPPKGKVIGFYRHDFRTDSTCIVDGRVLSDDPGGRAAWVVLVNNKALHRGFQVAIRMNGELFLKPSPWPKAAEFKRIDPILGPIRHPAIKPGNAFNRLLLVIRGRELVIFVNGAQVADPIRFAYDLTPSGLQFGSGGPGVKRAEFDRVEIREIVKPDELPK